MTSLDPGLAVLIFARGEIVEQLLQVGADVVEINLRFIFADCLADVRLLDEGEWVSFVDDVADGDRELSQVAADVGVDDVLHFHGVHHEHLLAFADWVTFFDEDLNDGALERRGNWFGAGGSDDVGGRLGAGRHGRDGLLRSRAGAFAEVVESGERVAGVELGSGESGRRV